MALSQSETSYLYSKVQAGETLYSPQDLAHKFNVSRRTIYKWLKQGLLHSIKAGPKLRYTTQAQLDTFIRNSERIVYPRPPEQVDDWQDETPSVPVVQKSPVKSSKKARRG